MDLKNILVLSVNFNNRAKMLYFSDPLLVAMAPNVTQEGHKPPNHSYNK